MTSAPTQVSDDDAKEAYLKRCMDMTHGQLYAELMRVHREATLLVQQAVEQEREACAKVCELLRTDENSFFSSVPDGRDALKTAAESIRIRGEQ